jgi:hypothetical protein
MDMQDMPLAAKAFVAVPSLMFEIHRWLASHLLIFFSPTCTTAARLGKRAGEKMKKKSASKRPCPMTSVSAANLSSLSTAAITKEKNKVVDQEIETLKAIYRLSKRCSGGADGGVVGTNGSIRPTCLVRMLRAMRIGGSLSGFFGGFSGHQGALRALFLSKLKIEPIVFVATTALISLLVDLTRVSVYFTGSWFTNYYPTHLMLYVVPSALAGTLVGKKYIHKVNHAKLSIIVGVALLAMGLTMVLGHFIPTH